MAPACATGCRSRVRKRSGKLASDLLENPLINSAITRAFSAREKAVHAQEAAMGALNLPSAADIDRLTRRLRTVSTRLEGIEESLDRLQDGVDKLDAASSRRSTSDAGRGRPARAPGGPAEQARHEVEGVSVAIDAAPPPVPREQERLAVDDAPTEAGARKQTPKKKS